MNFIMIGMPQQAIVTNKYYKENISLQKNEPYLSLAGGLMMRQQLWRRLNFNYGVLYSHQVQAFKTFFNNNHQNKLILSYLKIPLLPQYNFVDREKLSIFMTAGPQINLLITQEGAIINGSDIVEVGGAYKSLVLDGVISLGGEIRIYKGVYYNLQLRFDHSLHYINNLSYKIITSYGEYAIHDVGGHPWSGQYGMTFGLLNALSIKLK